MCVILAKFLPEVGWVIGKNRDRNYAVDMNIIQSNRRDVQRIYIKDNVSYYTEGTNEYGVSILSAAFAVNDDETESETARIADNKNYKSLEGRLIRKALFEKTPKAAAKFLWKNQLVGATLIADEKDCYLLEGYKDADTPYQYKLIEVNKNKGAVRTNHGLYLKNAGYLKEPPKDLELDDKEIARMERNRASSEERLNIVLGELKSITTPEEVFKALSQQPNKDHFMNPLRKGMISKGGDVIKKEMCTTGQIVIIPKNRTLIYRPIYSTIHFTYHKLINTDAKTFFEVVSSRKILSMQEETILKQLELFLSD